ncbi:hypothetical protein AHQ40_002666 [Salmonella enterica subsp. enterica serovar Lexington]|nr:hypothetical protein [Salmonella enterica subsp. enterica serovar Lexington]ELP2099055.1 hypothetical protein [Salmonella enterica subsp. enterica serovar Lexington]
MAAPETIFGVHENHSVKRSGQAGGPARAEGGNGNLSGACVGAWFMP